MRVRSERQGRLLVEILLSPLRFEDPDLFVEIGNGTVLVSGLVGVPDKRRELLVFFQVFIISTIQKLLLML